MKNTVSSGFMILHGNRPELLRELLVHWYRQHPLAPLEDEVILVQSNGMAQWLKLALAQGGTGCSDVGLGIAAAFDLQLPARFSWNIYRSLLGHEAVPELSPFDKSPLLWRLMRLLPALLKEPVYASLAGFLADDSGMRKRYQLAQKIADLFDQYQVYRADWLEVWAAGRNELPHQQWASLSSSLALEEAQLWQPDLWRRLIEDIRQTENDAASKTSRAFLHQQFLQKATTCTARPEGWPRRVTVFGISSLPRQFLDVLQALSRHTQVMLCVHNPCELYWADAQGEREQSMRAHWQKRQAMASPSKQHSMRAPDAHPLLASWGRQGRDYITLLDEMDTPEQYHAMFLQAGQKIDLWESPLENLSVAHPGLLHWLQDDIFQLRTVQESRERWKPADDGQDATLRFHVVHSPQRELEVLHDCLLDAFERDATLQPRDVIIMVPDIQHYAPHIEAVFGHLGREDARHIPYSMTDLGVRYQAPMVFALAFLLGVPEARITVSELFDLLDVPAVRARFAIEEQDLPILRQWVQQTHIRWGLDKAHRERVLGQEQCEDQNTWQHGLRQMLLGYAVGDKTDHQGSWHDIEPYGEVAGLSAVLAGRLARLMEELERLSRDLEQPATPEIWGQRLHALLADFFDCQTPEDEVLLQQMSHSLVAWLKDCAQAGLQEDLPLEVVRDHWLSQVDQPNLGQRFMVGRVTFATLMPMRAIPYRWIGLLGMNDGDYPRSHPPLDFDLMAKHVRPGDRSRREDDRYLFLEALLSAREHLHISWVGRSIIDNAERPPSVLVSQLRDHIVRCWPEQHALQGTSILAALTVEHRLQPFSPAYFQTSLDSRLYTYAHEWVPRAPNPNSLPTDSLPFPVLAAPITLDQLSKFLKNPVRTFFQERLGVHYERAELASTDQEPFKLDRLDSWSVQDQLITGWLNAIKEDEALDETAESALIEREINRFQRQGVFPIGAMGQRQKTALLEPMEPMFKLYREAVSQYPQEYDDIDFVYEHKGEAAETLQIQGTLNQICEGQEGLACIQLVSSTLIKKNHYCNEKLLPMWVRHLALQIAMGASDEKTAKTILVSKNGKIEFPPLRFEDAQGYFSEIVKAYLSALCMPLPLEPKTGFALLEKEGRGAACRIYEGDDYNDGEIHRNDYVCRAYPDFALLEDAGLKHWSERVLAPMLSHLGKSKDAKDAS